MLTGVFPVAPTTFFDDGALDLGGQDRVVDFLVDAGVDAVCVLANYSEQCRVDPGGRASPDPRRAVVERGVGCVTVPVAG